MLSNSLLIASILLLTRQPPVTNAAYATSQSDSSHPPSQSSESHQSSRSNDLHSKLITSNTRLNNNENKLLVSHKSPNHSRQFGDTINDIQIECNSDNIVVTLTTNQGFNGMIYPKGLSKNSTCMMEYHQMSSNITYYLPLKSCNTMSSDVEDGVEYFNTVMVQPHRRLVTNQGRGYHIRCRYQTKERTITNQGQQLSVNLTQSTPAVVGSVSMPTCQMRIYSANDLSHEVAAENVRIGDELHLVISLDDQDVYGMLVTNCLVRDGMNWGEQPLLDDNGCPVDEDIMPQFNYAHNLTRASVTFQAHKFPYTSSVYYQCNVRLCFREGGCNHVPPNCGGIGSAGGFEHTNRFSNNHRTSYDSMTGTSGGARHRRWIDAGEVDGFASEDILKMHPTNSQDIKSMNIEVFSGLHVQETIDGSAAATSDSKEKSAEPVMAASTSLGGVLDTIDEEDSVDTGRRLDNSQASKRQAAESEEPPLCMSLRRLTIVITLVSLLLMAMIIMIFACILHRRKRKQLEESKYSNSHHHHHHQQPNIYENQQDYPYLNEGYMRD